MQLEWDEAKRLAHLKKHDLDFEDAEIVFEGTYLEVEEKIMARFVTRF
jgi:uncharacterized DUF497 family protein